MLVGNFIEVVKDNNQDAIVGIDGSGVVCSFQHECSDGNILGIRVVEGYEEIKECDDNCREFSDRVSAAKKVLQGAVDKYNRSVK